MKVPIRNVNESEVGKRVYIFVTDHKNEKLKNLKSPLSQRLPFIDHEKSKFYVKIIFEFLNNNT
ncbi:hypothetical protein LCGC14_1605080 [marine sediment metagenome]|uniref:Uncharacterized protein n=1 Tax=marine sediment metagenome TaxID=412755 RepID=A0A0F9I9Z9_9ZZZZ